MKIIRKRGDTSNILQIFVQDSSSTTGAGLTGLLFNTASLTAYYHRDLDTTATAIALITMTVGTFTSSGFKEIDATNMPGWYQFCPPDAAFGSGTAAHSVAFHLKGATNMAPLPIECQLVAVDVEDTVRAGLTALPNVASGSAGAIPTTGTGANQLSVSSGQVILQTGTGTGQLDFTSGVVKANATQWLGGTIPAVNVTGVPLVDLKYTLGTISPATAGSVRADAVTGAVGSVTGAVGSVTGAVGSVTGNVGGNVTGTVGSVIGAVGSVTGNVGGSVASVTAAVSVTGDLSATMKTSVTTACTASTPTAAAVTGNVGGNVVGSVGSLTTNNDKTGYTIAAGGIGSGGIAAAEKNNIADACLDRRLDVGTDSSADTTTGRTWRSALRGLRNKVAIAAGTATTYKEDDVTASHTAAITTTAGNPISTIDPA